MRPFRWEIVNVKYVSLMDNIKKKQGKGFVELYATIFGISELEAINILAKRNHLTFGEMISFENNDFCIREDCENDLSLDYFPKYIECSSNHFVYEAIYYIRSSSCVKGAFVIYKTQAGREMLLPSFVNYNSKKFPAPCTVSGNSVPGMSLKQRNDTDFVQQSFLTLGQRGESFLLNMEKISALSDDGIILLCETPLVAIKIQELIDSYDHHVREKYLTTTWYGGKSSLDGVEFGYLYSKNVIFLPALNVESYINVIQCQQKCDSVHARNFSVLMAPITINQIPGNGEIERMDVFEQLLARDSISLLDFNQSCFLELLSRSVSFETLTEELKKSCWLSSKEKAILPNDPVLTSIDDLSMQDIDNTEVSFDRIFQPKKIAIILGANDSGKSIFLLSLLRAITEGFTLFGIETKNVRNVLLIDGENDNDIISQRNQRIKSAYSEVSKDGVKGSFHVKGMAQGDAYNFCKSPSRMDVENILNSNAIDVVAFDNLNSLLLGHVQGATKFSNFIFWIRDLEKKYGVAVVLVHHTKDEKGESKRASGSKEIEEKCQTVITISGRDDLKMLYNDLPESKFSSYMDRRGALMEIHIKKCKHVHPIHQEKFGCYLSLDIQSPATGPGWIIFPTSGSRSSVLFDCENTNLDTDNTVFEYLYLSEEERRIMIELAHKFKNFNRKMVDILLKCSNEKSRQLLNSLKDNHALIAKDENAKGKSIFYYLVKKIDQASEPYDV